MYQSALILTLVWSYFAGLGGNTFVNVGTHEHPYGVPKASVEKYAADHGISFRQAANEIGATIAGENESR